MDSYIYALGFFDGVHIGHQALLKVCRELAAEKGCRAGVITFSSHPDTLVRGSTPLLINTPEDREMLLRERFGMDTVVTLPFDNKMCATPWQEFLRMLRREYHAVGFVCGEDFRFGSKGTGTASLLAEYCRNEGLEGTVVPEQILEGTRVSSTYIRTLLENGDAERAERFLGHPHVLTGTVVSGKQLGRTLGIPTANLHLPEGLVVPRFGVYACRAWVNGKQYAAVTNVGIRPTVSGSGITVEPWLLDFSADIYGCRLTLEFFRFLRPERKFPSLEALQGEIRRNADQTRAFFGEAGKNAT